MLIQVSSIAVKTERSLRQALVLAALLPVILGSTVATADELALDINIGQQKVYSHPRALKRVAVADPAVATVTLTNARTVLINGKSGGNTEISLWDDDKAAQPSRVLQIAVSKSLTLERQGLNAVSTPALQVKAAGQSVALAGEAGSIEEHALAAQSVAPKKEGDGPLDASSAAFDSHVQIDIKVVEVSRTNAMRFGFFLGRNGGSSKVATAIGGPNTLTGVSSSSGSGSSGLSGSGYTFNSTSGFLPVLNAFNLVLGNSGSGLLGSLSILESNGFAYTLAEPSLTAISGQTATFLAGGEFPIPIRTGGGADSSITIQYKEYGVRLMLTPTILDSNRIFLKVSPEVSELDFTNAVQTGGVSVPGLKVRRTETSVSLGDGESFVLSGMVSRNALNNIDKIPGLGNIPILGAFFSSKRFDREDKELLMVVTPHLIRPITRDAKLPDLPGKAYGNYKPSFSEFFSSKDAEPKANSTGMSR